MSYIKKATILVTNICNFNCLHCFWGKVEEKKVISSHQLDEVLALCLDNQIKNICFSGGEPFLYLNKIIESIAPVKNNFNEISICSNGYWGQNAKDVCELLKVNNITTIELSYDRYHARYISEDCIKNIIDEAQKIGIKVLCVVAVSSKLDIAKFHKQISQYLNKNNIIYQYIGPFGNGKTVETDYHYNDSTKCEQFLTNICVDFDSLLYYCCGPYVAMRNTTTFCVGQFNQENLNLLKANKDLYNYMKRAFCDGEYMCKTCLKRLDNYIQRESADAIN